MQYSLAVNTWGKEELSAIQDVIDSGNYTMGEKVKKFEKEFSSYFNCYDSVMVNSGSSANLLMLSLLKLKYKLSGDIIVPAVSWSTTFFPVNQNNFKLNFVDVDRETLNINPEKVIQAITPNTCAILAVNLLGNSCEFIKLKKIAKEYNLILIEDNCESFGALSDEKQFTGTIGEIGTFSFFFSHHLQTMEGGMVICKNKDDADFLRSLRAHGWVRDLPRENNLYEKTGDPFKDSFTFITPGYCLRPLEMSGAIGSVQLKKWEAMKAQRIKNAKYFTRKFRELSDEIIIQKEIGNSSWFGFSLVLKNKLKNRRDEVIKALSSNEIETRPIVAGNFMRNPVIKYLDYIDNKNYCDSNYIHENGFFIGNNIVNLDKNIDLVYKTISKLI